MTTTGTFVQSSANAILSHTFNPAAGECLGCGHHDPNTFAAHVTAAILSQDTTISPETVERVLTVHTYSPELGECMCGYTGTEHELARHVAERIADATQEA